MDGVFGNTNMGWVPKANMYHRLAVTLTTSGMCTMQITDGADASKVWSESAAKAGLWDGGDPSKISVTQDHVGALSPSSPVEWTISGEPGTHKAKLLSVACSSGLVPACVNIRVIMHELDTLDTCKCN